MLEQLIEAWQVNHRVRLKLLDALSDDALKATLSTRGSRDVARQLGDVLASAVSLNSSFRAVSCEFVDRVFAHSRRSIKSHEKWRKANTGNVFTKVYYLEGSTAIQLDVLRKQATEDFEKKLFHRSGALPVGAPQRSGRSGPAAALDRGERKGSSSGG